MNKVESISYLNQKPRIRFCHDCGEKLRGNHHAVVKFENIDHDFIYHKECARKMELKKERREG